MSLINEDYKKQLQEMHQTPKTFFRGVKVAGKIKIFYKNINHKV